MRCTSPFCIKQDEIRGREFEKAESAEGLSTIWCPKCIELSAEIQFFSAQTATMVRDTYKSYIETNLPKEVKLILEQFAQELMRSFGEEL